MKMKYILTLLLLVSFGVHAERLITPSYEIEIGECPEGYVSCDTIQFTVKDIKTGVISNYMGKTMHTTCEDGETPCRFLGYSFQGDRGHYFLSSYGTLVIDDQSGQAIMEEQGQWSD